MLKNPLYKYGPSSVCVPTHLHLGQFLLERLEEHWNTDAVINAETDERIKFGDVAQKAMNLAVSLHKLGVKKGEIVAFCSENRPECCATIIGVLCTGATVTAINYGYTKGELTHVLGISKPKYIFCSPTTYKSHGPTFLALPHVKKLIVYGNETNGNRNVIRYEELVANNVRREEFEVVEVKGQSDVALILYSSGTTGLPKGVMLTHLNFISICCQPTKASDASARSLALGPWFHAMGLVGLLINMSNVKTLVYMPKFTVDEYLKTVERYKISFCTVVPPMLVALTKSKNKYDLSSVQMIFCGAAPLSQETIETAKAMFPNLEGVTQAYGMTETTLAVTRDYGEFPEKSRKGTVGTVAPGTTIKILDLQTRKPLGPNQPGEICVKSVSIMKGYIGKDNKEFFDDEGFYSSGDIGYYDEDGYFYIVDRLKELIKYKGYQVPPAEIEAVLLSHPQVRDAGVVGVAGARGEGEVPLAFVVMQPGAGARGDELVQWVAERLSNPKHLRGGVRFVDSIPRNPSGKILRRELKKMVKETKSKL